MKLAALLLSLALAGCFTARASVTGDHARGRLFDTLSYVNYGIATPIRIDARLGLWFERARYDEKSRPMFGLGFAWLPWHGKSPREHVHSEKGWTDIGPDIDVLRGLGLEVAVDALPSPAPAERGMTMVTVSVVGDLGTMIDK